MVRVSGLICFFAVVSFAGIASAQTARVQEIEIADNIKGQVYYNQTFFVNEENAPVQITSVETKHVPSSTASTAKVVFDQLFRYLSDKEKARLRELSESHLEVKVSASGSDAVAVKFGVIAYDAFKEHLGGLTAVTMEPPNNEMRWNFNPSYLFKFEKYGVVGVYVRQVRLKDGTIWNSDADAIQTEFSKRFAETTKEQLLESE